MNALPIDSLLPAIVDTVVQTGRLVLEAPPGAGKTTRVPPALMRAVKGKVLVLEPRRLAARASAERVAEELEEDVGQSVGYRVRLESVPGTRIEYVTEGLFLRMLSSGLEGVGCVVLDEFHERHVDGDLALAFLRARGDLPFVVMSATLDAEAIAGAIEAPRLRAEGRSYPVDVEHASDRDERRLEQRVASAVRRVLGQNGDVLVFLPGVGEIERAASALGEGSFEVLKLHGSLSPREQARVFSRAEKQRVILATNVAETSVTVEGVTVVVDSGLARILEWDPSSGISRLSVAKVSKASAIQRAGRAGRTAPGRCIRLYSRPDFDARPEHTAPEILRADAAEVLLATLQHGHRPEDLPWLDSPPSAALDRARLLLLRLGALEHERLTEAGKRFATLPLHPRLAAVATYAAQFGSRREGALAASIAAERDFVPRGPATAVGVSDLRHRIELLGQPTGDLARRGFHVATMQRIRQGTKQLDVMLRDIAPSERGELERAVFRAFSDRLAQRMGERDGQIEVLLREGGRALLAENSVVRDSEWLAALSTEMRGPRGRERVTIGLASAVEPAWIEEDLADELRAVEELALEGGRVMRTEGFKIGELWLDSDRRPALPDDAVRDLLVAELSRRELTAVFPEQEVERVLGRLEAAQKAGLSVPGDVPRALLRAACTGVNTIDEARGTPLEQLASSVLAPESLGDFERLAPRTLTLPSGRALPVRYARSRSPWVESYLQDFFGMKETPRFGGAPLTVHLWAPNRRPIQVTTDLESFWRNTYPELSRSLSRRYPKHVWPDDPASADPARLKRHLKR